jgi:5-methylcytosine-specific restriction endonuclease McrA
MNFGIGGNHSVILMSVRPGAPYNDRIEDGGTTLIYEGHDQPRGSVPDPKLADQVGLTRSGKPTENGKFHDAAQSGKIGHRLPERVKVYEKILSGIWSYNGVFHLIDSWIEFDWKRQTFKFKLIAVEGDEDSSQEPVRTAERRRIIPTRVKLAVWKRDHGKCIECGATDELHFDHDLPWAKGGTSITELNVQLLCARHNLSKSDRIV